ncbi:hypothetical protein L3X38_003504 [Prunus dulcis]|uniref:Uncharacterized protein n=1 Tax=Prunus dulcis TaxID=3755 RepID=A0AAD5F261_PRUDU|nr:hypothetical protein L3X38_003504 [Prunus dulcis]
MREKREYNHRLSRKGYAGLENDLEETMPGVAEKAKLIDELQKQVSEGSLTVFGNNDVLTMALGLEHPRSFRFFLELELYSWKDKTKSLKIHIFAGNRIELFNHPSSWDQRRTYICYTIKRFVHLRVSQVKSKVPKFLSDKASFSGVLDVRTLNFEDDSAKDGEKQEEMSVGSDRQTFILIEDITQFAIMDEIGATVVAVYMRCLFDVFKTANMVNMVGLVDLAQVNANSGSLTQRSRLLAN